MKYAHFKYLVPILLLFSALLTITCEKVWDEHYDESTYDLPDYTLNDYIQNSPELSTFSNMLSNSGFDSIISASQSYTVWAPNNEALNQVDITDIALVNEIIQNHIARSRITTSGFESQSVRVLNGKLIDFIKEVSGYSFGGKEVVELNISTVNGLVHVTNEYAPYLPNLWEFIERTDNLDSLRSYLYSQNKIIFDPINSTEIGVNSDGQVVYDSAFKYSNPVLEKIGAINAEDSIYTAIMPDNNAWNEAYGRIESYFNFPEDGGGPERQREITRYTLVKDMLFHGRISNPQVYDSLVSTTGTVFYNPDQLFTNISLTESLSNGISNLTPQMPYADTLSWFKEIRVEAENEEGRTNSNNVIFTRNSYGSGLDVSENEYILVDPTSAGSSVEFSIPNTLSAKYNIYCVFVPASIVNPTDITTTKATFVLTYIRRATGSTFIKSITPEINTTLPTGLTKMLVDQFDFEYANYIDEDYNKVKVKLEVINDVTTEEEQAGEYSRTMRIDCIILEPVSD